MSIYRIRVIYINPFAQRNERSECLVGCELKLVHKMEYFFIYILRCSDGSYYVGHTDNLDIRIAQRQTAFYSGYTSKRLPVQLVYTKTFYSRDEALINGNWNEIAAFSKRTKKIK